MPETVVFHLGTTRDASYAGLAWADKRDFLATQKFHHPVPYRAFTGPLHDLLRRSPHISPENLPLAEPAIHDFCSSLEHFTLEIV